MDLWLLIGRDSKPSQSASLPPAPIGFLFRVSSKQIPSKAFRGNLLQRSHPRPAERTHCGQQIPGRKAISQLLQTRKKPFLFVPAETIISERSALFCPSSYRSSFSPTFPSPSSTASGWWKRSFTIISSHCWATRIPRPGKATNSYTAILPNDFHIVIINFGVSCDQESSNKLTIANWFVDGKSTASLSALPAHSHFFPLEANDYPTRQSWISPRDNHHSTT